MDTQQEYEDRCRTEAWNAGLAVERAPLAERKANAAEWLEAMKDPALVVERISWLLNGSYGYGEMMYARQALNTRGNVEASLCQLVARYEWRCPGNMARARWHQLTEAQRKALSKAIARFIVRARTEAE